MQRNIPLDQVGQWSRAIAAAVIANSPEELASRFACGARALIDSDRTYVGIYRRDEQSVTIDAGDVALILIAERHAEPWRPGPEAAAARAARWCRR